MVEEVYNYFVNRLHTGQAANIPYKAIRSQKNEPKWMKDRLKHYIRKKKYISDVEDRRRVFKNNVTN